MKVELNNKDVIWSYFGTAFSMASNLIMLPFMMYYLSPDMLGMWYVFASVGAISTLFDFGFSVTFARNITYCWSGARTLKKENVEFIGDNTPFEPDYVMMNRVLAACKIIYGFISAVVFLVFITFGTNYIMFLGRSLDDDSYLAAWIIYVMAVVLNLYYGYYSSFLRGVGAIDRVNKNTVIARSIQVLLSVALLWMGIGIVGTCSSYLIYGFVFRVLGKRHFYNYRDIGQNLKKIDERVHIEQIKDVICVVWHNAWRDGLISISTYLCNQASTVICSLYLSLEETGVYSIGVQIATAIAQIAGTTYNAYQPELQSAYIKKDCIKTCRVMSLIVMSYIYVFVIGTFATCIIGLPILRLIRPSSVVSVPILIGLCAYQFVLKLRNCYTSYFSCTNRIIYLNGFVVSSIMCVLLSYVAIGVLHQGIWGLIGAQIVCQLIYNMWKWPTLAHTEMNLPLGQMIKEGNNEVKRIMIGILG